MGDHMVWVVCIGVSAVLVFLFRFLVKKKIESLHERVELNEIYLTVSDSISIKNFTDVFNALGDSYSIDPRVLRPEDSLSKLDKLDSWVLGAGADKMNKWLECRGLSDFEAEPRTIYDLLFLVESQAQYLGHPQNKRD